MAAAQHIQSGRYRVEASGNVHINHQRRGENMISVTLTMVWLLMPDSLV